MKTNVASLNIPLLGEQDKGVEHLLKNSGVWLVQERLERGAALPAKFDALCDRGLALQLVSSLIHTEFGEGHEA